MLSPNNGSSIKNNNNINNSPATTSNCINGSTIVYSSKTLFQNVPVVVVSISITFMMSAIAFIHGNSIFMHNSQSHYNCISNYIFINIGLICICLAFVEVVFVYFIAMAKIIDNICDCCQVCDMTMMNTHMHMQLYQAKVLTKFSTSLIKNVINHSDFNLGISVLKLLDGNHCTLSHLLCVLISIQQIIVSYAQTLTELVHLYIKHTIVVVVMQNCIKHYFQSKPSDRANQIRSYNVHILQSRF